MIGLSGLIFHHARYHGDATAVVFEGDRLTYRQFAERVARVGDALRALGVGPGDKVATLSANSLELLETYWAVPAIGAVFVPLSPMLSAPGLSSLLDAAGARCLVAQESMIPTLAKIRDRLPPQVVVVGSPASGFLDYHGLVSARSGTIPAAQTTGDDLYNIMFTSGTTGVPKGIMHSHFARAMTCLSMATALRMSPASRTLHTGAIVFNGAFTTMMPTFYLGATYVLHARFEPRRAIETIEAERITHTMLVPAQIVALLNSPHFDPARLSSLECILSLGAPLLRRDKEKLAEVLPGRLYELYGLTEGFATILDRDDVARKSGSVGTPSVLTRVRIVRDDGSDAAAGEAGEIVGQSPAIMSGYYGRPDLTEQTLRDGWIHSGDIGYLDEDGFLYLVDRKKDMIDSGGVKVYPRDIEQVAAAHPDVLEVAVFGVPDEKWGETPLAAVILRDGSTASPDALRDWINERVSARYQRVSGVAVEVDFPRNAAGKTLKRELRDRYWAGANRKV